MKQVTLAAALLGAIAIAPMANAQSFSQLIEDIEVNSTLDTVSEYVFRGIALGGIPYSLARNLVFMAFQSGAGIQRVLAKIQPFKLMS